MNNNRFREGEHIVYQNGDRFEIGKIKRITKDGAFIYYSSGDTAAKTPFDCMHKLVNEHTIKYTSLGGSCWTSVENALPHAEYGEGISVLTIDTMGLQRVAEWNGGNWCWPSGEVIVTCGKFPITHWMPLPLPPEV